MEFVLSFYDDINKTPILKQSNSKTYADLINETNNIFNVDIEEKLYLAQNRFKELIGCDCKIKPSKVKELFELKYSRTADLYTIYKLYNYIITEVGDIKTVLAPNKLKCELFELDNLDKSKLVGNAIWFCEKTKKELKQNAIKI